MNRSERRRLARGHDLPGWILVEVCLGGPDCGCEGVAGERGQRRVPLAGGVALSPESITAVSGDPDHPAR